MKKRIIALIMSVVMFIGSINTTIIANDFDGDYEYIPDQIEYQGHLYQRFEYECEWGEAKLMCEEMNGHLLTIDSAEEENTVNEILDSQCDAYWINAKICGDKTGFEWIGNTGMQIDVEDYYGKLPHSDMKYGVAISTGKTVGEKRQIIAINQTGKLEQKDGKIKKSVGFICEWDDKEKQGWWYGKGRIEGYFDYASTEKDEDGNLVDESSLFIYDQNWFELNSKEYYQPLATVSLCLALSAFNSNVNSKKYINVKTMFRNLQYYNFEANQYYKEKPGQDTIGVAIAEQSSQTMGSTMPQSLYEDEESEGYTILGVAVRGGGYGKEWSSNLTMGYEGEHHGFSEAKDNVLREIKNYIDKYQIEGKIKVWITGYSRASAVANLTAAAMIRGEDLGENVQLDTSDIYAYCFEVPRGVDKELIDGYDYSNIHNIINDNDIVTYVAPNSFNFVRYGMDKLLPSSENYDEYNEYKEKMLNCLEYINKNTNYSIDKFKTKKVTEIFKNTEFDSFKQYQFVDNLVKKLCADIKSRENYVNTYEQSFRELCNLMFGNKYGLVDRIKDEMNTSEIVSATIKSIKEGDKTYLYNEIKDIFIKAVKDIEHDSGTTIYSDDEIEKMVSNIADLIYRFAKKNPNYLVSLIGNVDEIGQAHYPEICLAWMYTLDDNYGFIQKLDQQEKDKWYDKILNWMDRKFILNRNLLICCPVDVEVYNSKNKKVAEIKDGEVQQLEGSSLPAWIDENGNKCLDFPQDGKYKVLITATDSGYMNVLFTEYNLQTEENVRKINHYNLPLQKGKKYTYEIDKFEENDIKDNLENGSSLEYKLFNEDGEEVQSDEELKGKTAENSKYNINVFSNDERKGIAYGDSSIEKGMSVVVNAYETNYGEFEGWYTENNECVSKSKKYKFTPQEDILLEARFVEKENKNEKEYDNNSKSDKTNDKTNNNLLTKDKGEKIEEVEEKQQENNLFRVKGILYKICNNKATAIKVVSNNKKLVIPNYVKIGNKKYIVDTIESGFCKNNKKIKTVKIGKNVKCINKKAFYKCRNLKRIILYSRKEIKFYKNTFKGINKKCILFVVKVKVKDYKKIMKLKGVKVNVKKIY